MLAMKWHHGGLLVCLFALLFALVCAAPANATLEPLNPWYAFRSTASFSFLLGYEVSVMVGNDGKYFYGRGCCYGVEYELQVWGTGRHGTTLGQSYGTVNAPPVGLDNGKETALLYLPNRNKLVYWRWNDPEFYVAAGRPPHIREDGRSMRWVAHNAYSTGLPLENGAVSMSNDGDDLLVFDYSTLQIHRVSGDNFRIISTTQLTSSAHILVPSANEDLHTFAFDGEHYLFGSFHSGHCFGIYSTSGESLGAQCDKLGGSMLYYDWSLHMYEVCGTDSAAPTAFDVFNPDVGNGAHCTFWATRRTPQLTTASGRPHPHGAPEAPEAVNTGNSVVNNAVNGGSGSEDPEIASILNDFLHDEEPVACPEDFPLIAGRYRDEAGNEWNVEQEQCLFVLSYDYVMGRSHLESVGRGRWGAHKVFLEVGSKQDPAYPGFSTSFEVVDRDTLKMGDDIVLKRIRHFND